MADLCLWSSTGRVRCGRSPEGDRSSVPGGRDDLLTVAKVADLANTRIYELQNAIEFRNPQDDADDAGAA